MTMAMPESGSGGEIPREMLEEILVKLPTKDVAIACCVSTLWRDVVRSPSFRKIHIDIAAADDTAPEVLLVSEKHEPGSFTQASVSLVSSGKPMCRVNIPSGYTLANVCNGFLCFAGPDDAPPLVCNPVTGEHLTLLGPPPLGARSHHLLTALGFSPSTREYKLFRLSVVSARCSYPSSSQAFFPAVPSPATTGCYLDVCTLGGGSNNNDGWRRHPYLFPNCRTATAKDSPPIAVDGKLYVLTMNQQQERPGWILVIDVASEAHWRHPLPVPEDPRATARVNIFELHGRPCLVVNTEHWYRPEIKFWLLSSSSKDGWDLCYSFFVDEAADKIADGAALYNSCAGLPRGAWLDEKDRMLCYRIGDDFNRYDMRDYKHSVCQPMRYPQKLPSSPADRSWIICGGYRPTLLSPLTFASPPSSNNRDDEFDRALLRALRRRKSKRHAGRTDLIGRPAKRMGCSFDGPAGCGNQFRFWAWPKCRLYVA